MSEAKLDQILASVARLEQQVTGLKSDVSALKGDVSALKGDVSGLVKRQDDTLTAFRDNWSDLSGLYRSVREDLHHFQERLEAKLSQVTQAIQALRDSLERQDFRSDELARRVGRLELGDKPPL
jgi:outer membrane murein-binding lipoprotein Lpp